MYDYVIVGAGSAGCVLRRRLSENPSVSVLLLEAGPPDTADEIHIPAALNLLFQSSYDWGFRTVPQDRAAGQAVYWPRGRVVGGSSSINAMIYIRGNKHDYNTWRDEYGCDGWGYNDLLPYFIRAEGNARGSSAYHGGSGPLSVVDPKFKSAVHLGVRRVRGERRRHRQPRLQRPEPGRRRLLPGDAEGRQALVGGRRVPAPGAGPAEPDRADRRAGHLGRDRGRPCRRSPVPAPRHRARGAGRGRGHPVRRRGQQPAAADAVRHRARRPPARARHRGGRRQPGRGREPVRPPHRQPRSGRRRRSAAWPSWPARGTCCAGSSPTPGR